MLKTDVCDENDTLQRWRWIPQCPSSLDLCPAEDDFGSIEVAKDERYVALRGKGQVKLEGFELCVSVGGKNTEREAGPYFRRDLLLGSCDQDKETLVWNPVI